MHRAICVRSSILFPAVKPSVLQTLADEAAAKGKTVDGLVQALLAPLKTELDKRVTAREEAILRADAGISVEPVRDSDVLVLKVRTPSPKLCLDAREAHLVGSLCQSNGSGISTSPIARSSRLISPLGCNSAIQA